MKLSPKENMMHHLTNIEMAMNDKAEDLARAADQIIDLNNRVADGRISLEAALREADEIWSSVMESEYDPDY